MASFDDSRGKTTNYMIDLSNGATGSIARNTFVQGENKENYSAFIMVAPEGTEHSSAGLSITQNEAGLVPDAKLPIKILGNGDLKKKFTVKAGWYTKSAAEKLSAVGGTVQNAKGEAFAFPKPRPKFPKIKK